MSDSIKSLATNMVARKQAGLDPYILFLGAGASISSGCSSMVHLVEDILRTRDATQFSQWQKEINEAEAKDPRFGELLRNDINKKKLERFFEIWAALDSESRYAVLRHHLWNDKTPSAGYMDLANLVKEGYFSVILSTNLDNLMEKALTSVGLIAPQDFIAVVNGKDSPDEVKDQLDHSRVPVKIVKLHGTLESPRSYAFTTEELFTFEKSLRPSLTRVINQSLLVVGHSMQDRDLTVLFEDEGKEIHFVNPTRPEFGSPIDSILRARGLGSIIDGEDGKFDRFLRTLRSAVEQGPTVSGRAGNGPSINGFLQSIGYESELKAPRSRYKNLQTLYVKPTEYDDILTKLEQEHILFIIGEPHMGKTYTAIYLLWEYYQEGYEALHIRHDEFINRLHRHDGDLKALLLELFTPKNARPRIIHFDDPFGETLERRTEAFATGLDILLGMARGYEHLRVIITSRLNIFNEALADVDVRSDLSEIEKTLRVHTSYRREVLLDIFRRYIQFHKPTWASDERIMTELEEKLPEMLPAPHNIEFFVSTSGTLNTVDAILDHVEESKKMVSALASWMKHMPPHEQIFLAWVELSSTASTLFSGESVSELDVERVYNRTLATFFEAGHIPGIPTMPFPSARDKFETILLERRDGDGESLRLDFVHPSYHEAFWFAVNQGFPLTGWLKLIGKYLTDIMRREEKRLSVAQFKTIERYGSINRDLDQLLLLSAESNDVFEQLMALEHMLNRPEHFTPLPQFHRCMNSIASSNKTAILRKFLNLYDSHFHNLPVDMLSLGPACLLNNDIEVRGTAQTKVLSHLDELPESVCRSEVLQQWRTLTNFLSGIVTVSPDEDWVNMFLNSLHDNMMELGHRLKILTLVELDYIFRINITQHLIAMLSIADVAWDDLSSDQKLAIIKALPVIRDDDIDMPFFETFIERHIEEVILAKSDYSDVSKILIRYVTQTRLSLYEKPEQVLISLLKVEGVVQYEALTALLLKRARLTKEALRTIENLIDSSPDWWVGGAVGQTSMRIDSHTPVAVIKNAIRHILNFKEKHIKGAMLAEIAQSYFSQEVSLRKFYKPVLMTLIKDKEIVAHAEAWMDYQLNVYNFNDEGTWSKLKGRLQELSEKAD